MALFDSPDRLQSTTGGAASFASIEAGPDSGSFSATPIGTGQAQGDTQFTINADPRWILLSHSFFRIRFHVTTGDNKQISSMAGLGLADCGPGMLFNQVRAYIGGRLVEESLFFPQTYTATTYAAASRNWMKTFGAAEGAGESWLDRVANLSALPFGNITAQNYVEWCFKPSLSLLSHAHALKAGQLRIVFTWNPNAQLNLIGECSSGLLPGTVAGTYKVLIDEFVFQQATITPMPDATLAKTVLIDLTPCRTQLVPYANASTNQQVDVPPSTFRLMFGWQPALAGSPAAANLGLTANTTAAAISQSAGAYVNGISWPLSWFGSLGLNSFQWNASDLGISMPNPIYNPIFYNRTKAVRCYRDFCDATQGVELDLENGSLELGTADSARPVPLVSFSNVNGGANGAASINTSALFAYKVDASTSQGSAATGLSYPYLGTGIAAVVGQSAYLVPTNQLATELSGNTGYLGRMALLAFPVVKAPQSPITRIYVAVTHATAAPSSDYLTVTAGNTYNMYVFAMHTSAVAIRYNDRGDIEGADIQNNA